MNDRHYWAWAEDEDEKLSFPEAQQCCLDKTAWPQTDIHLYHMSLYYNCWLIYL